MAQKPREGSSDGARSYSGRMYGSGFGNRLSDTTSSARERRAQRNSPKQDAIPSRIREGDKKHRVAFGNRLSGATRRPRSQSLRQRFLPRTSSAERRIQGTFRRLGNHFAPLHRRLLWVFGILLVTGTLGLTMSFELKSIEYVGNSFLFYDRSVYEGQLVSARADMHPFERSNILLFDEGQVREKFAELADYKDVQVRKDFFSRTVTVVVQTEAPSVLWQSGAQQFVIDADGFVEPNPQQRTSAQAAKESQIPFVDDQANSLTEDLVQSNPDQEAVSPQLISFVAEVYSLSLATPRVTVDRFLVGQVTQEIRLVIDEFGGIEIKMSITEDASKQFRTLVAAATALDNQSASPEYIDVRIPGRAVYRE